MANATDDVKVAEKIITGIVYGQFEKERAMQICHWLFSFNSIEKGFTVKCYQTNVPDFRFCIDRGHDCEGKKIRTIFVTIRSNLQILFRAKNIDFPYFKIDQPGIYYISPEYGRKLDMEVIKKHILEAYCLKIKNLDLASEICAGKDIISMAIALPKEPPHRSYLPNREDFESAYRSLARLGQEVSIDDVLDKIASDAIKAGFTLKDQWRMKTERNIREFWSKK